MTCKGLSLEKLTYMEWILQGRIHRNGIFYLTSFKNRAPMNGCEVQPQIDDINVGHIFLPFLNKKCPDLLIGTIIWNDPFLNWDFQTNRLQSEIYILIALKYHHTLYI